MEEANYALPFVVHWLAIVSLASLLDLLPSNFAILSWSQSCRDGITITPDFGYNNGPPVLRSGLQKPAQAPDRQSEQEQQNEGQ